MILYARKNKSTRIHKFTIVNIVSNIIWFILTSFHETLKYYCTSMLLFLRISFSSLSNRVTISSTELHFLYITLDLGASVTNMISYLEASLRKNQNPNCSQIPLLNRNHLIIFLFYCFF